MQAQQVSACPAVSWPVDLSRRAQSWRWFMRNVLIPFAYTRALQLSWLGSPDELSAEQRAALTK